MRTFERTRDDAVAELSLVERRRRPFAAAAGVVLVVVVTAAVAYAAASPHSVTKTVVVTKAPPTTLAPTCAPGAAPGSCNVDEEREALIPDQPLDAATRSELAAQLVAARAAALKYPTVASAVAAGFIPAGKFSPETGAHYIRISAYGTFDPSNPPSLIYDGTTPTSVVVGTMFLGGAADAPAGFAGPNDHWHRHSNTCVIFGGAKGIVVPFAADSDVTSAQCSAAHGTFMPRTTWMVHAWVVPGWESPLGVFSHNNPDLKCGDGTDHANAVGFCKGPGDV